MQPVDLLKWNLVQKAGEARAWDGLLILDYVHGYKNSVKKYHKWLKRDTSTRSWTKGLKKEL